MKTLPHRLRAFIVAFFASFLSSAHSATLTVCDEASLRASIAQGGLITFKCDTTITLSETIVISNAVTLDAAAHAVTLSGGNKTRIFHVVPGASLELIHLALADGSAINGGAILNDNGQVTASNCTFQNNRATGASPQTAAEGGAIYNTGNLSVTNSVFTANKCIVTDTAPLASPGIAARGGAIHSLGPLSIQLSQFLTNTVESGVGGGGSINFAGTQIDGGSGGEAAGGAIHCGRTSTLDACTFLNNVVRAGRGGTNGYRDVIGPNGKPGDGGPAIGAAVMIDALSDSLVMADCTFADNSAHGGNGSTNKIAFDSPERPGTGGKAGGAVYLKTGTLRAVANSWIENTAWAGHGASTNPRGDGATGGFAAGAGIHVDAGELYATNNTFFGNRAIGGNGGAGDQSTKGGQGGRAAGGAIFLNAGIATISHATIAFNECVGGSSGPSYFNTETVYATPRGRADGAGIRNESGVLRLANSILATNTSYAPPFPDNCSGSITDLQFNISSDNTTPFSLSNVDPKLAPLQDNGGPTKTFALQPDSPAIDFSNPTHSISTDQRGFTRAAGLIPDAGAFELQQAAVSRLDEVDLRSRVAIGGDITLQTPGLFTVAETLTISKDTTLKADGVTFDGRYGVRVFRVQPGIKFTLVGATVANGRANEGGGLYNDNGNVLVQNCKFTGNSAVGSPGINGTNSYAMEQPGGRGGAGSAGRGGAIFNAGSLVVSNSHFVFNSASGGVGGNGGVGGEAFALLTLGYRCRSLNTSGAGGDGGAGGHGGGAALWNGNNALLIGTSFSENRVFGGAGGTGGPGGLPGCNGNQVGSGGNGGAAGDGDGAAIHSTANLKFLNSACISNRAVGGAGGHGGAGGFYSTARGAKGGNGSGGAIANFGSFFLTNVTFAANTATGGSGGMAGLAYRPCDNGEGGNSSGGAILDSASAQIVHCTFSANDAIPGQAVPGSCPTPPTNGVALSSTFAVRSTKGPSIASSILHNTSQRPLISGPFTDKGHNLASDSTITFTDPTSRPNFNPHLQPLDTSAPIPFLLPALNSPARDVVPAALAPATDQRGVLRPVGSAADIGAIEIAISEIPPDLILNSDQTLSLSYTAHPGSDYILFESVDLIQWIAAFTNRAAANGSVAFNALDLNRSSHRFFQVRDSENR